jgi:tRNA(Ile)-lysidine synthase
VRFSGYGARFKPAGSHLSKPIKQWFKLWNIPPWERERIALLFVDDRIVMVGGIVSADFSD